MPNPLHLICFGLIAVTAMGCESTRWNWLKKDPANDVAGKGGAPASAKGLVDYLNENAKRVRTLQVNDLDVDATMDTQSFNLRGRIYAEKPKSFRMKVTLFGKDEVDIGSNPQEFWFWALKNPDKYQYFCSYKDLNAGRVAMMPLPIQPEWVMETLGLGPYGPADKYQVESEGANLLRLVEKTKSPQGYPVRKVIVMNRKEMKSPQPQITAFLLLDDATGREICSAHITSTTQDHVTGAILPYRMELRMAKEKIKMALKLDGVTVNGQIVATAFQRPQMAGVEQFNLATGRTEPWNLQRVGGFPK
ncbi:MAG: hypothetical protein EXR98_20120 [Gemmataceae bacterium]|nr:hypothetical protein [Gemmataceae bacterium]